MCIVYTLAIRLVVYLVMKLVMYTCFMLGRIFYYEVSNRSLSRDYLNQISKN